MPGQLHFTCAMRTEIIKNPLRLTSSWFVVSHALFHGTQLITRVGRTIERNVRPDSRRRDAVRECAYPSTAPHVDLPYGAWVGVYERESTVASRIF